MSAPRRYRSSAMAIAPLIVLMTTGVVSAPVGARRGQRSFGSPGRRRRQGHAEAPTGRRAYLDIGAYVAAVGGAFEIWASRPDYDTPVSVWQVVRRRHDHADTPFPHGCRTTG